MTDFKKVAVSFVQSMRRNLTEIDYTIFINGILNRTSDKYQIPIVNNAVVIFQKYPSCRIEYMKSLIAFLLDPTAINLANIRINEWEAIDGLMELKNL